MEQCLASDEVKEVGRQEIDLGSAPYTFNNPEW